MSIECRRQYPLEERPVRALGPALARIANLVAEHAADEGEQREKAKGSHCDRRP